MAEAILSGYKTIATPTITLTSITDNTWAISSAEDNGTNKYLFGDFELVLGSRAFTGTDSAVALYIIPSADGTNYPDFPSSGTAEEQEAQYYVGSFTTTGATAAQRIVLRNVALPNGLFKLGIRNQSNVTLAASGNTLKYRPHGYASL